MNAMIWQTVNALGWWWWFPPCILAAANLALLAGLNAPITRLGRTARVLAWLAHIPMLFVGVSYLASVVLHNPALTLNSLGLIALPLMIVGNFVLYLQLYLACRAMRKEARPNAKHWTQRVLGIVVE